MKLEYVLPSEIEKRSFEIIGSELDRDIPEKIRPIVMRAIHTTADFDYADNLWFSENAVDRALGVLSRGAVIVTDTNMAKAGINKAALARHGCECVCYGRR
jgi:precorrin-8X/cobalt-precorrin-8 methylmutase